MWYLSKPYMQIFLRALVAIIRTTTFYIVLDAGNGVIAAEICMMYDIESIDLNSYDRNHTRC